MMIAPHLILTLAAVCSIAQAAVRSGNVKADLISTSRTYEAGKPVQMAIRLTIDPGWHSYWLNPGEGGMKTSVKWDLPAGWTAGELENPVPSRFIGGGLASFGYKGAVIFPVKLNPPADAEGPANLMVNVSWLACDDQACVPGRAELSLMLGNDGPNMTPEAPLIAQALTTIPRTQKEWGPLKVEEQNGQLVIQIPVDTTKPHDFSETPEIFPATPGVINAGQEIKLTFEGSKWTGTVPKSEYATERIRELSLVVAGKSGQQPILLHWKIE
jgi:DsbC/DsbD-like thiol-disulfide interchange protein